MHATISSKNVILEYLEIQLKLKKENYVGMMKRL